MAELTFSDFIESILKIFKQTGCEIWPEKPANNSEKVKSLLRSIMLWCSLVSMALLAVSSAVYMFEHIETKDFLAALPTIAYNPFTIFRVLKIYQNRKVISEILLELQKGYPKSSSEAASLNHQVRPFRMYRTFLTWSSFMTFLAIILTTIIIGFSYGTERLLLDLWVPFSFERWDVYLILSSWVILTAIVMLPIVFAMDMLMFSMVTMVAMEFNILKLEVEKLGIDQDQEEDRIKKIVDRHHVLIGLSEKLEKIYSSTILYNMVQCSVFVCVCAFKLSNFTEGTSSLIANLQVFGVALNQIFFYSYLGQKMIDASAGIAESVYNCQWYKMKDKKLIKAIKILMIRSQKPQQLTAKKFSVISFESSATVRFISFIC